jgi:RNA polymerase primary sigma factor
MKSAKKHQSRTPERSNPARHGSSRKAVVSKEPFVRPANDIEPELDFPNEPSPDAQIDVVFEGSEENLDVLTESISETVSDPVGVSLVEDLVLVGASEESDPTSALDLDLASQEEDEEEEPSLSEDDDTEAAAETSEKSDDPQSFLAMYFRDMAELSVLRPEQEFETARMIEELEIELWTELLGFAPWADHVVHTVETAIGANFPDFKPYMELSLKSAKKTTTAEKRKLSKLIVAIAVKLKDQDIDRVFVDAALTELQRLHAAARLGRPIEGLPFSTECNAFKHFAGNISNKARHVKRAKNEFVKANLRLVVSIARRFNHGRLPLPDLIQEGNIGLMKAVERYDYRRGFRFSTYASWWIRHAISRALADKGRAVRLPVHMIDAYHRVAKSERELQSKLERPATTEEIATVTGIETDKLEKMRTFLADTPVSLDRSISEDDGRRLIDVLVDPNEAPSPPEQMMSTEMQQEMIKLLSVLKPIEADILRKRFGLINDRERTLKEIGDEYRLSRERVRQLQEQALGKMRKAMAKREIL